MRISALTSLCALALVFPLVAAPGANDKDKLQGVWKLTGLSFGGKELPAPKDQAITLTFSGNKVSFREGNKKPEDGTFTVDPSKTPKHMDLKKGADAKDEDKAIYQLTGDTLKIGLGEGKGADSKRPASFDGPGVATLVFTREGKK